jgi:hypothetical protein
MKHRKWGDLGVGVTSPGVRALMVPLVAVACRYGTDAVAPPGNQAANREHNRVPTVAGQTATEKRGEQTRAEGRGVGR